MIKESIYLSYLSSLLEGEKENCCSITRLLLDEGTPVKDIYTGLFQRSMYAIGKKWINGRISISCEHIATQITLHLMSVILSTVSKSTPSGKSILLFCADKEFHEIGMRMVSDMFEINGWKSFFLGANNPPRCIIQAIKEKKPDVVGISFNFYMNLPRFLSAVNEIKKEFPGIKIIVGGQALEFLNKEYPVPLLNMIYLKSLDEVEIYIKNFTP